MGLLEEEHYYHVIGKKYALPMELRAELVNECLCAKRLLHSTTSLDWATSFEKWTSKKPILEHLRRLDH